MQTIAVNNQAYKGATEATVFGPFFLEIGDSVFGVKDSLITEFAPQSAGTPSPDGRNLGEQDWARARFDIVLAPEGI